MAFKIYGKGNYFFIDDTVNGIRYEQFKKNVFVQKEQANANVYTIEPVQNIGFIRLTLVSTDILKENETPYTDEEWNTFYTENTGNFNGGAGGSQPTRVANYSALPDPATVPGQYFWCANEQGFRWIPGEIFGGTWYNSGTYYSNGTTWEYQKAPYNATLSQVNLGANTSEFLTPYTFDNSNKILNSFQKTVDDSDDITEGVVKGFVPLPTPGNINYYLSGLKTWETLPVSTGTDGEINFPSGVTLGNAISATITASTNNLTVTDIEKAIVLRLTSTGNFTLTGLAPFNNTKAWMLFIVNVGTNNIIFTDNDANSLANNRWLLGSNKTVQPSEGIIFFYDPISNRWRGGGINI